MSEHRMLIYVSVRAPTRAELTAWAAGRGWTAVEYTERLTLRKGSRALYLPLDDSGTWWASEVAGLLNDGDFGDDLLAGDAAEQMGLTGATPDLAAIVAANAEMGEALTLVGRALDAARVPDRDTAAERVELLAKLLRDAEAKRDEACKAALEPTRESIDTHRALDDIGAPPGASPAERVRAMASTLAAVDRSLHVAEARLLQAANDLGAALGESAPDTAGLGTAGLSLVVAGLAARVRGGGR